MIYLIEDRDYVKIGFTKNLKGRMDNYETDNCYFKLIDSKPGDRKDESALHELCKKWHYKREWFYNVPEVREIWNNYQHSFKELNYIKEINTKVINLIYQKMEIPTLDTLVKWKSIQNNIWLVTEEFLIKEANNEEFYKIWKDFIALRTLLDILLKDTKKNFSYDFGLFKAIVTWTYEEYPRYRKEISFTFISEK